MDVAQPGGAIMNCPASQIMDTQTFVGTGFATSDIGAHRMAKASCDAQALAVANAFAALAKCQGKCTPVGSIQIVSSSENGPIEVAPGWWIDVLEITYNLIVSCVQVVVPLPPPLPLVPRTVPGDIAPVTEHSRTEKPPNRRRK